MQAEAVANQETHTKMVINEVIVIHGANHAQHLLSQAFHGVD